MRVEVMEMTANNAKRWIGTIPQVADIAAGDVSEFMARVEERGVDTRSLRVMWPEGRVVARAYQDGDKLLVEGFHEDFSLRRWWGPTATWITVAEEWEWLDEVGWAHFIWQGYTHPHPKHPQFSGEAGRYETFELWRLEDGRHMLRIEHIYSRGFDDAHLEGVETHTFAAPEEVVTYLATAYPQVARDCAEALGLAEEE